MAVTATNPPTLTVEQVAVLLGISRSSAYRGIERGDIPCFRIGRRIVIPTAKILDVLGLDEVPVQVLEMAA